MPRPKSSTLLAATGVLHVAVTGLVVRSELWATWRHGVAEQPQRLAVLWSVMLGLMMLVAASAWRVVESRGEPLPASFGAWLAVLGLMVVVPLPASGGWLLFPQAGLIFTRARGRGTSVPDVLRRELGDWLETADVVDVKTVTSAAPLRAFTAGLLGYQPAWMTFLYAVRMVFVRLLGMKQPGLPKAPSFTAETLPIEPGRRVGFFRVDRASETTYAVSIDDVHLWAGLAVLRDGAQLRVVTVVRYKNRTGPVYFNVIRPFHHVVVKAMIRAGLRAAT